MITGNLKSQVDAIWQDFYNENMAQTSDIVNQLTMLMFIKILDDKQSALEAQAAIIGAKPNQKDLTFKEGVYINYEYYNDQKRKNFEIPYEDLRWKNFRNLNSRDLSRRIRDYVIPFIQDPDNTAVGQFGKFSAEYVFGFNSKERLLTSVVDKLSNLDADFTNTDIMGDIYEYMCGSGISGQFRTPRHIIDMAVEMMKPKIGERCIDSASGTFGFMTESAKYIHQHQKIELLNNKNRKIFNDDMFFGCDNDTNMARIGYMNAILHGIKNPTITIDSLLEHENAKDYIGTFDLALQNPPFAGSIVETATNPKILAVTKTKKTELLFVALMLLLLKNGGRGMSIVPDGVLFGSSNAHKSLRKELIDNNKLIGVISMPSGIFMSSSKKGSASKGAGVSTAFIIIEKGGKTDNVWFYDMTADGFTLDVKRTPTGISDIPDIVERYNHLNDEFNRKRTDKSFMVPAEEIRQNDYDLSINKYKEIVYEKKEYRSTRAILEEIDELDRQSDLLKSELKMMLEDSDNSN